MSFNDPKDVQANLTGPSPPAATPAANPLPSAVPYVPDPLLNNAIPVSAASINTPPAPAATIALVRANPNGIAAGVENPRAVPIGTPTPPQATAGTTAVLVGSPTLSTAAPIQPPPAAKPAGIQMVAQAPSSVQVASQLTMQPPPSPTQTASQISAPQTLTAINNMNQS